MLVLNAAQRLTAAAVRQRTEDIVQMRRRIKAPEQFVPIQSAARTATAPSIATKRNSNTTQPDDTDHCVPDVLSSQRSQNGASKHRSLRKMSARRSPDSLESTETATAADRDINRPNDASATDALPPIVRSDVVTSDGMLPTGALTALLAHNRPVSEHRAISIQLANHLPVLPAPINERSNADSPYSVFQQRLNDQINDLYVRRDAIPMRQRPTSRIVSASSNVPIRTIPHRSPPSDVDIALLSPNSHRPLVNVSMTSGPVGSAAVGRLPITVYRIPAAGQRRPAGNQSMVNRGASTSAIQPSQSPNSHRTSAANVSTSGSAASRSPIPVQRIPAPATRRPAANQSIVNRGASTSAIAGVAAVPSPVRAASAASLACQNAPNCRASECRNPNAEVQTMLIYFNEMFIRGLPPPPPDNPVPYDGRLTQQFCDKLAQWLVREHCDQPIIGRLFSNSITNSVQKVASFLRICHVLMYCEEGIVIMSRDQTMRMLLLLTYLMQATGHDMSYFW